MVSLRRDEWVALGQAAIIEVLEEQFAAPLVELEARVCAKAWRDNPKPIDPHRSPSRYRRTSSSTIRTQMVPESIGGHYRGAEPGQ
jgi:hypothetical protein